MLRLLSYVVGFGLFTAIVVHDPGLTAEPGAIPSDPAKEDLTRVDYPSQRSIDWEPRFVYPNDTLESMFGEDWVHIARFNRVDRRHTYPGMTLKVPRNMEDAKNYSPLPQEYAPAKRYSRYILVSLTEQWIGGYEYGKLKLSIPAATGKDAYKSPTGIFRVDARHRHHTSSLYRTEDDSAQYPMDNAIRFHIGPDNVSYWIHARDLPGRPASHGCIGTFDEGMQNRVYGIPADPVLIDSQKLYEWAVVQEFEEDSGDLELLEDGPVVEVTGDNPKFLPTPAPKLVLPKAA